MTTTLTPAELVATRAVKPGHCRQCGHPDGTEHDLYGTHCRAVIGRDECLCEGPLELRRPRARLNKSSTPTSNTEKKG